MLTELCAELKNYFLRDREADIHYGEYTISGGSIDLPFLLNGQYFRIVGSVLNDGVYQRGVDDQNLADEEFFGSVWSMQIPKDFIALCEEIEAWQTANAKALSSPYQSESFAGYSYTKATGSNGGALTWQEQFRNKLNAYRRISVL